MMTGRADDAAGRGRVSGRLLRLLGSVTVGSPLSFWSQMSLIHSSTQSHRLSRIRIHKLSRSEIFYTNRFVLFAESTF